MTLLEALKQMDTVDKKLLFVFNRERFVNILSIGDIQRAILKNIPLDTTVDKILRKSTRTANSSDSLENIKSRMIQFRMECMPILDDEGELVEVYFWEDLFSAWKRRNEVQLELPVVIMAGGKGTRLKPITNVLPKPLVPIGEKTILEEIMNHFIEVGCNNFLITVNYKAEMIKQYFESINHKYKISFYKENKPLGTAGSLSLLKDKIDKTFFITNCDIIVEAEYDEILEYHRSHKNEITIVAAFKHMAIPYGTVETGEEGILKEIKEKPDITFKINSGMYILEPHLLDEIPVNKFFQITTLINNILKRKGKVGVFPISEGSWKDIGEWDKYLKNITIK